MATRVRRLTSVLTGAALLALSACTSPGSPPASAPDRTSTAPTAATAATNLAPTAVPATPEAYVAAFVTAWRTGDRAAADRLATPPAAESAFALTPGDVSDPACFTHAGHTDCEVVDLADQSSIQLAVDLELIHRRGEHAITRVVDSAGGDLPRDPDAYASALMDAWKAQDKAAALRLATSQTVDSLFTHGDGSGWTHRMTDGAAGTSYPIFDGPHGAVLTLQVSNAEVSMQQTQAVHSAAFEK